jgi:hypothetical protein
MTTDVRMGRSGLHYGLRTLRRSDLYQLLTVNGTILLLLLLLFLCLCLLSSRSNSMYRVDGAEVKENITGINRARAGGILFRERVRVGTRSRFACQSDTSVRRVASAVTGGDHVDSIFDEGVAVNGGKIPVVVVGDGVFVLEDAGLALLGDLEDRAGTEAVGIDLQWQILSLTGSKMDRG